MEKLLRELDDTDINENKLRNEIGSMAEELSVVQQKISNLEIQISGLDTSRVQSLWSL